MDYNDVEGFVRRMRRKWMKWSGRADLVINTTSCHPAQSALTIARFIDRHHIKFLKRMKKRRNGHGHSGR